VLREVLLSPQEFLTHSFCDEGAARMLQKKDPHLSDLDKRVTYRFSPRTVLRMSRRLPPDALSFSKFVLRRRVLAQYRDFLRALVSAPDDLRQQVRIAFRERSSESSAATIKQHLAEGAKQLNFARSFAATNRVGAEGVRGTETWVGTGEAWDVRGRVGTHWPWSSSSS
jgi:hypothetical protein